MLKLTLSGVSANKEPSKVLSRSQSRVGGDEFTDSVVRELVAAGICKRVPFGVWFGCGEVSPEDKAISRAWWDGATPAKRSALVFYLTGGVLNAPGDRLRCGLNDDEVAAAVLAAKFCVRKDDLIALSEYEKARDEKARE